MPSVQKVTKQQNREVLEHPTKDASLTRSNSVTKAPAASAATTASTGGVKTPQEYPEFIKQALAVIEKKVRNLEKRRTKLDEYKDLQHKGQVLNEDQLSAVSKYEEVKTCLDLVKELDKQLNGFAADALKAQRKQAKREQIEREELVRDSLRDVQRFQAVLSTFVDDKVRQDFLASNSLSQDELTLLDEFNKLAQTQLTRTYENDLNEVADHYLNLVEGRNKPVLTTTYTELRKLFDRILASSYWTGEQEQQQQQQVEQQQIEQTQEQQPQEPEQQQVEQQEQQRPTNEYVVVTSTEVELNELERQEQQQQQVGQVDQSQDQSQDPNTFFTTLNRPDNSIKEFLTENNEGLNFLQDSQIHPQSHEQQQQQQFESGDNENQNSYGFGKRNGDGFQQQNPRNGGGYNRRPFNNADNNGDRRTSGGRGGYNSGRGGGRGGYRGDNRDNRGPAGSNGDNGGFRGGYRGKPRNPGQQYNREGGQPPRQHYQQQPQQQQQSHE